MSKVYIATFEFDTEPHLDDFRRGVVNEKPFGPFAARGCCIDSVGIVKTEQGWSVCLWLSPVQQQQADGWRAINFNGFGVGARLVSLKDKSELKPVKSYRIF